MDRSSSDDSGQSTHGENDGQDQNTPHQRLQPGDACPTTVSLEQRAPTAPVPKTSLTMYLKIKGDRFHAVKLHRGQENHCIRSKVQSFGFSMHEGYSVDRPGFPYPPRYYRLVTGREERRQTPENSQNTSWSWKIHTALLESGVTMKWENTDREVFTDPVYVVVGLFPRGHGNPRERVVFVNQPKHLFWKVCWAAFCLRGVSGTFLSLRHIKGFRLYKVRVCASSGRNTPTIITKI